MSGPGSCGQQLLRQYCQNAPGLAVSVALLQGETRTYYRWQNGSGSPEKDDRIYEIGSITKTFTGSLLCRFLQQGRIRLTDRVSDYFEVPAGYYYPTVEQLATHTAGYGEELPYSAQQRSRLGKAYFSAPLYKQNPFGVLTPQDVEAFVRQAKLQQSVYPPVYSNLGITILGTILGKIDGRGIRALLAEFLQQQGLSGFSLGVPPTGEVVPGYHDGRPCGNWQWGQSPFVCMGGLYATADSLLDYGRVQLKDAQGFLRLGHVPRTACFEPDAETGLCWLVWPQHSIVWHNGGTGCFKTFFGFISQKNTAVAVLSNQKALNGVTPEEIGKAFLLEEK